MADNANSSPSSFDGTSYSTASHSGMDEAQMKKLVTEVFRSIIVHINLDVKLLAATMKYNVLKEDDIEEIENEKKNKSNTAGMKLLLTRLDGINPQNRCFSNFLSCLKESENRGNRLIGEYILDEGSLPLLDENFPLFNKKFKDLFCDLVTSIYPSEILPGLNGHLSEDDQEMILATETQMGKSKSALILLITLSRSTSDWPEDFVRVCEECKLKGSHSLREAIEKDKAAPLGKPASQSHTVKGDEMMLHEPGDGDVKSFSEVYMDGVETKDMCEQDPADSASKDNYTADAHINGEFGNLVLKVSEVLDVKDVQKLATLFCFSHKEEENILSDVNPGLILIKSLEDKKVITSKRVLHLREGLIDAGLSKEAEIVTEYMKQFSQEDLEETTGKVDQEREFGVLLLNVAESMDKDVIQKLSTLFRFSREEEDRVQSNSYPSLYFLKKLIRKGNLGVKNVANLIEKLTQAEYSNIAAIVEKYQSRFIVDKSGEILEEASGSNQHGSTLDSITSQSQNGTGISQYRLMVDQVGQKLTKDDSLRLGELLELSKAEVDGVARSGRPSHEVLRLLEKRGKFSEKNEIPLYVALEKLKLEEAAKVVQDFLHPRGEDDTTESGGDQDSKITLLDHQRELAEPAKAGINYIIISPTGSGKTFTAGNIIKDHLEEDNTSRKRKVAFIVEKRSLADQQEKQLNEFFGRKSKIVVAKVTGDDEVVSLSDMLKDSDVLVVTAGVIHNEFKKVYGGSLTVFSLMVFDECHHCTGGHSFNQVMRMYRKEKKELIDLGQSTEILPQVIGMTATLGAGKANELDKAVDHALHIMANMDSVHIQTVEKHRESLYKTIGINPKETIPVFVERLENDPFEQKVKDLMSNVEGMLTTLPDANLLQGSQPFDVKDSKEYEQWVINNKDKHCPEQVINGDNRRNLLVCLDYLLNYHRALCINREVRSKDAYNFLKQFYDKQVHPDNMKSFGKLQWDLLQTHTTYVRDLEEISHGRTSENPLLKELEDLFVKEYTENQDSLGFLFAATIEGTQYLKGWIEESPRLGKLLKTHCITRETSQKQREEILKKFRNHSYNLLIVTSVADEGWSVKDLNLVVRLNYITSDFAAVQQSGRLRVDGGRSYLVCYGHLKQSEKWEKVWQQMMENAVEVIKKMSPLIKEKKLKMFQERDERLCEEAERKQELRASSKNQHEYTLCCKKCEMDVCSSFDIKKFRGSQHYVASQEFCSNKMECRPHHNPGTIENIEKIGKLYCKACGQDWGIVNKLEEQLFPVIKIKSFVLVKVGTGERKVCKSWKDVPFEIEYVENIEDNLSIEMIG